MKRWFARILVASLLLPISFVVVHAAPPDAEGIEFFEKQIRPVLAKHCYQCHSDQAKEAKGGLLLHTRAGIRAGGESGPAVVPGHQDESLLLEAIRFESLEMPPDEQLPESVIADFEKWIRMGAPDPREGKPAVVSREIDFEKARQFWSFQPPAKVAAPKVKDASWPRSDIDRFLLARLEQERLRPAADAPRLALVRRVYFDLIGLPPTPEQVDAFLGDTSPDALERLVEELLASPHFGERWGRHWLDVVRYGESSGMERNYTFPHAWRYRDWVIAALNADKPYDEFVREQLAGDLLPADSDQQRNDRLVATGMLAIGPKSLNEKNREKFLLDVADDQVDVTSRAFLGITASCARCHDHKFDPIPTKEYYSLVGIFRSTETLFGTRGGKGNQQAGNLLPLAGSESAPSAKFADHQKQVADLTKQLKVAQGRLNRLEVRRREVAGGSESRGASRAALQTQLTEARDEAQRVQSQLDQLRKNAPPPPDSAMGVRDTSQPADCRLRIRGEVDDLGPAVPRGFLTVCTIGEPPAIDGAGSGRLELAEWIVSPENPLTARVMVNRIWQNLFGRGLVETANNFGANGTPPSHPELLDYLAIRFVEQSWSVKTTIRELVLSRAYQMSDEFDPRGYAVDPDTRLLWRMPQRRLDAEALRDAMLLASGQLELTPPVGSVVARVGDGDIGKELAGARFTTAENHRSVYLPIVRSLVPEMLSLFDFPEPSIINDRRDVTTVPTQALYMMNSPFVLEQARLMAQRLLADRDANDGDRVDRAYRLALCRGATMAEKSRAIAFIETVTQEVSQDAAKKGSSTETAWSAFCQALFACAEFRYID